MSVPTRVALVTHYYPAHGGGIELVAEQLAKRLASTGRFDIRWFASDVDAAPSHPGVQCEPQPAWNGVERRLGTPYPVWTPASLVRLGRAIRACDVVHVHDAVYLPSLEAALLAKALRKRLVVTQHVGEVPFKSRALRFALLAANAGPATLLLRAADAVAFVSPTVRAHFARFMEPGARWSLVPNGVDTSLFAPAHGIDRRELRASLALRPDGPLALFVGRRVEKKGLHLVHRLAERTPHWQWCIVGEGPIDPTAWRLSNVSVRGRLSQHEVVSFYRAADALVLPSVGEGFPLVVQEALSCGLPVVVHPETREAGGLPTEACRSEPVQDEDACERWLRAIATLIEAPEGLREQRRGACRTLALQRWSWQAAVAQYEALLSIDARASKTLPIEDAERALREH